MFCIWWWRNWWPKRWPRKDHNGRFIFLHLSFLAMPQVTASVSSTSANPLFTSSVHHYKWIYSCDLSLLALHSPVSCWQDDMGGPIRLKLRFSSLKEYVLQECRFHWSNVQRDLNEIAIFQFFFLLYSISTMHFLWKCAHWMRRLKLFPLIVLSRLLDKWSLALETQVQGCKHWQQELDCWTF